MNEGVRHVEAAAVAEIAKAKGPRFLIVEGISNLGDLPPDTLNLESCRTPGGRHAKRLRQRFLGQIATVNSEGHNHLGVTAAALNVTANCRAF